MRCIIDTVQATTKPGSTLRLFREQPGRERHLNSERGAANSVPNSLPRRATSWPRSTGVPVALRTPILIYNSKDTVSRSSSSPGLSHTHASNQRFVLPLSLATTSLWYKTRLQITQSSSCTLLLSPISQTTPALLSQHRKWWTPYWLAVSSRRAEWIDIVPLPPRARGRQVPGRLNNVRHRKRPVHYCPVLRLTGQSHNFTSYRV